MSGIRNKASFGLDSFTPEGAFRLAQRIEDYWRKRGQEVTLYMEEGRFISSVRACPIYVRSDMVNGQPRKAA